MTDLESSRPHDFQRAADLLNSVLHVTRELLPALAEACRAKMREHPSFREDAPYQTLEASVLAYHVILCDTTITVEYIQSLTPEEALEFSRRLAINISRRIATAYSGPEAPHV